jgi:hypothetical protein
VVRSFRHAATLTAAQLVSTWITVSEGLAHSRDLAKAQLDAEERKKGGKVGVGWLGLMGEAWLWVHWWW